MQVIVGEKIIVRDPIDKVVEWCKNNLVLDNPDYYKKVALGKWVGNTPNSIFLYEKIGNELWLPFGCLRELWRMIGKNCQWISEICPIRPVKYVSDIKPYDYQEKAILAALKRKNGILVMPCGSGKTQSGLEIISRIGGRALWLTHTQDLLNQSKKRAESVLSGIGIGTITGGRVNIGTHITFATVQTMCCLDLSKYKNEWDIVIVDECQHCCGSPTRVTQFYKVVSNLNARYKFGLTATPKRADGLEKSMFALIGGIIHEVSKSEVKDTTCPIKVVQIETNWTPDYDAVLLGDGTIDYNKVIDNMIHDSARYVIMIEEIFSLEGPTIVLASRVEYLQRICEVMINRGKRCMCLSGQGQSKKAKEERKVSLEKLNHNELDCIFATYALAKEGLDVPNLRYLVMATPEKDETTVVQSVGRVGRKADGKQFGTVIDFVDNFGMYRGWAKKRQGYYKKIDAEIIDPDQLRIDNKIFL